MYKVIAILFFLQLSNLSRGQVPHFFADGARWVYHTHESSEPGQYFIHSAEEQIVIHGDTLIGGLPYFKLYTTRHNILEVQTFPQTLIFHTYDSVGPTFLRYDTLVKSVYYLPSIDSTERLIYDFDLHVGDTTPMQSENFPTTVIRSIDSVSIFGVSVKRFFLTDVSDTTIDDRNYILERIGGSNGLTYYQPEYDWVSGQIYSTRITCFQYQDSIYPPLGGECPFIDFVSANHEINEVYTLTVSPNPTQGLLRVTIGDELLNATCTIVDCLGRVAQSFKLTELQSTAHLSSPGMYFWRVEKGGRLISTGKLICN